MSWRDLPSLSALRAFAAFAETGGVVPASQALNVSHAAISQNLRALETHLDVVLLDRSGRALKLTAEGEILAQAVSLGFGAIRAAVQDLARTKDDRPVHITCTPTLATHWLMPRLADFRARHPEIDLAIDPRGEVVDLRPGGIDIALRFGRGAWPGLEAEPLIDAPVVIVAHPDLVDGRNVTRPEDLLDLPWLEEIGTNEASHWLRSRGVTAEMRGGRVILPGNLRMDALFARQGVAVMVRDFVASDLAAGRLVELFREDDGSGYFIAYRPGVMRPAAKLFLRWLRAQRDT